MTSEELCLRYQAGDLSATDELIKQCNDIVDPLAKRYAAKYDKLILTEEDYKQEGLLLYSEWQKNMIQERAVSSLFSEGDSQRVSRCYPQSVSTYTFRCLR